MSTYQFLERVACRSPPTKRVREPFHLFQFSRYIREPFQKSRYGSSPKKRFGLTNSASNILARPIGAAAPIGPVLFHHAYIGPVLVLPPLLFLSLLYLLCLLDIGLKKLFLKFCWFRNRLKCHLFLSIILSLSLIAVNVIDYHFHLL